MGIAISPWAFPLALTIAAPCRMPKNSLGGGEMQRKCTPFPQTARHGQSSAHGLRGFLRQAQTQTSTMRLRCPSGISPIERLEDVRDLAGLNSLPSILDGDQNLSRLPSR